MPFHVVFGQFDSDGETLDDQNDSGKLEGYLVDVSPRSRVDKICGMGPEYDAAQCGNGRFTDIHALLDNRGTEHKKRGEAPQDDVHQVGLRNGKVIPRHCLFGESRGLGPGGGIARRKSKPSGGNLGVLVYGGRWSDEGANDGSPTDNDK